LFVCSVPDISSAAARLSRNKWNCLLLEHLWYFTPRTLAAYLAPFGFELLEVRPFWFPVDLATFVCRLDQTFALRVPPPSAKWLQGVTIPVPAGLLVGAFRRVSVQPVVRSLDTQMTGAGTQFDFGEARRPPV